MKGKIIKGIGGFYYVSTDTAVYTCKAKGIFRKDNRKPLIGDNVEISVNDRETLEGNIDRIYDRDNELIRPAVANIDFTVVVQSVAKPSPQLYLLDRYLVSMEIQKMPACIAFNKIDLDSEKAVQLREQYEKTGYRTFALSAKTGEGTKELLDFINGKSVALAGPSGVGKSTLTNLICPDASMETGGISRKIERGKHTTRHSEIFVVNSNTFLCDTPGFTAVLVDSLEADDLRLYMPDFAAYEGKCRYTGCNHIAEPDCAVKKAVGSRLIAQSRYESYKKIYDELKNLRRY